MEDVLEETTVDKAAIVKGNNHVEIVVAEGHVTLEDLHRALDTAIKYVVPRGGCNCGLTGFDLSFIVLIIIIQVVQRSLGCSGGLF